MNKSTHYSDADEEVWMEKIFRIVHWPTKSSYFLLSRAELFVEYRLTGKSSMFQKGIEIHVIFSLLSNRYHCFRQWNAVDETFEWRWMCAEILLLVMPSSDRHIYIHKYMCDFWIPGKEKHQMHACQICCVCGLCKSEKSPHIDLCGICIVCVCILTVLNISNAWFCLKIELLPFLANIS